MSASERMMTEPTWFIEWMQVTLALVAGLYLVALIWIGYPEPERALPSFAAAALSHTATTVYGLILTSLSAAHIYALIRDKLHYSVAVRRYSTLTFFFMVGYLTALRIVTLPERIIWLAMLFTTMTSGVVYLHLRLRNLE